MSSLNLNARRTLPKHASENCAVGVTLQAWKKQSHNRCPRCDQPETAQHVLVCRAEAADEPWKLNVTALEKYTHDEDTDPFLQAAILRRLDHYRFPNREHDQLLLSPEVHAAVLAQDLVGWNNLLFALPVKNWKVIQDRCYRNLKSKKTARKWMTGLLKKLWSIAHGQWLHRNAAQFDPDKRQQQIALKELQNQITEEHMRGVADLPKRDRIHFRIPLLTLLNKRPSHQKSWLKNVTAARNHQARKTNQVNDPLASAPRRTGIEEWMTSKKLEL